MCSPTQPQPQEPQEKPHTQTPSTMATPPPSPVSAPLKPSSRTLQVIVISLILGALGLLWLLWQLESPKQVWLNLQQITLQTYLLAFVCVGLSVIFASARLKLLCRWLQTGHPITLPWPSAARAHILSVFGTTITPGGSGGTPLLALALSQQLSHPAAWAVATMVFVADAIFYIWVTPSTLGFLLKRQAVTVGTDVLGFAAVAVLLAAALVFVLIYRPRWISYGAQMMLRGPLLRFRRRGMRFMARFTEFHMQLTRISVRQHLLLQGVTALSWGSMLCILYVLVTAQDITISLPVLLSYQMLIIVVSSVMPTPGASGYFELAISQWLNRYSSPEVVVGITILWRVFTYYLYFILGPLVGGMALEQRAPLKPSS